MDNDLKEIESQLEKLTPTGMPNDMVARMAEAMDRWQESVPIEEKIVPFQKELSEEAGMSRFNVWATAAAVALMGVVGGVMFKNDGRGLEIADVPDSSPVPSEATSVVEGEAQNVFSVSNGKIDSQLVDKPSQQIVYDADGRPQRLVRIEFMDRVVVDGADGKKITVEKPSVEYYLVPVEVR